jgi:hypothetical protein
LMFLSLANNSLSGTIPPSFASNFTTLTFLDLSSNALMAPLPTVKKRHPTKMKYGTYEFY